VAYVLEYFETEIDPATCLIDRALKLSPSYEISWTRSGWLRLWAGHPDFALEHFEASLCLNPMRRAPASFGIAVAHFFARRLEKAAAMRFLSMQETCIWDGWGMRRRLSETEAYHAGAGPGAEHWRVQEDRDFYLEGLRLAIGKVGKDGFRSWSGDVWSFGSFASHAKHTLEEMVGNLT
jgi:hypothetical protein